MPVFSNSFRVNLPSLISNVVSDELSYRAYIVHHIQTTPISSISSLSSYIDENEKALLVGQTNLIEGIYLRSGSNYAIQSLSDTDINWVFIDVKSSNKKTAVYVSETGKYIAVKLKKILLEYNFSTTTLDVSPVNIFDFPVQISSPVRILLTVNGFLISDKTKMYYGEFKRIFYNDDGNIIDSGDMGSLIFNKDKSSLPNPVINFSNATNASASLTAGSGSNFISWFCKAELIL